MTQRTIDDMTFDTWRGQFQAPRLSVTSFTRSGVSGIGAITSASQPQKVEVTAQIVNDLATCQSAATSLTAMVGTFVAAEDDVGNSYDHVLVESCSTVITPAVGDGDAVLTAVLVLWPDSVLT